jgi:hypothetical protein
MRLAAIRGPAARAFPPSAAAGFTTGTRRKERPAGYGWLRLATAGGY